MRLAPEAYRYTQDDSCWGVHRVLQLQRPSKVGAVDGVWVGLGMDEQRYINAAYADRDFAGQIDPPVDTGMVAVYRLAGVI